MSEAWPTVFLHLPTRPTTAGPNGLVFSKHPLCFRPATPPTWRLFLSWRFSYAQRVYEIPKDFPTDFYSLPRAIRIFWDPIPGRLAIASVIHDYLVRFRKIEGISLMHAHAAMRDAMITLGAPHRARLFYAAVVAGGWTVAGDGYGELSTDD